MPGDPLTPAKLTISRQLFENYFSLSGAGYVLANDALAAGWISTPYEIIEVVCLVDRVFASILLDRMLEELQPLGKSEEYLICALTEVGGDVDAFTAGYIRTLMAETLVEIEAELGVSPRTTENNPNDKNALFAALVEGPVN